MSEAKQNKVINIIFWVIFVFYLILMIDLLLTSKIGLESRSINFIPFKSIAEGINVYDGFRYRLIDVQVWGNVLIAIPAGIYVMFLSKKDSFLRALLTVFLLSLGIEIIQFIFKIGASDIDDIILNCLGGVVGILIYYLLKKIFKTKEKTKRGITIISLCVGIPVLIITIILIIVNYVK